MKLGRRLRRTLGIAKEKPLVWCNVVLILLVAMAVFVYPSPSALEVHLRLTGLFLQMVGIWTVFFDLTTTARGFGKGSIWRGFGTWLVALFRGRNIVMEVIGESLSVSSAFAVGSAQVSTGPNASMEARVAALEQNVRLLSEALDRTAKEMGQQGKKLSEELTAESGAREAALSEVNQRLKGAVTGNYYVLLFGVCWLAVGVILATLAPDMAKAVAGA